MLEVTEARSSESQTIGARMTMGRICAFGSFRREERVGIERAFQEAQLDDL